MTEQRLALRSTTTKAAAQIIGALATLPTLRAAFMMEANELAAYGTPEELMSIESTTNKLLDDAGIEDYAWSAGKRFVKDEPANIGRVLLNCTEPLEVLDAIIATHPFMTVREFKIALAAWQKIRGLQL